MTDKDKFEKARDEANPNEKMHPAWEGNEYIMWEEGTEWARDYFQAEIEKRDKVLFDAKEKLIALETKLKNHFDKTNKALEKRDKVIEELKEYEWKYKELCK